MLQRTLGVIDRLVMPVSLAITALLFLQWPLRDLAGAGASQANDLAQWLFAFYVAVAIRHAGLRHVHLTGRPDLASHASHAADARTPAWRRLGAPLCVLAWSAFLLAAGAGMAWQSLLGLERFPETANPGYFLIKLALMLMGLLLLLQAGLDLLRALRPRPDA
ncbi:MAG: C4-dicarboxylate ABC transporter substrate-binding protein [Proteobacteria bacterium]|nr:C4-dicarboxylate ABC transporter substrate-binding protein [Pseudomonadota bacterium]